MDAVDVVDFMACYHVCQCPHTDQVLFHLTTATEGLRIQAFKERQCCSPNCAIFLQNCLNRSFAMERGTYY